MDAETREEESAAQELAEPSGAAPEIELHETLKSRHCPHGGIPVGVLLVPKRQANGCRRVLEPYKLRLVAVSWTTVGKLLLHLPPEAAAALDEEAEVTTQHTGDCEIADSETASSCPSARLGEALRKYVRESGAVYYPSVRVLDPILEHKGWPRIALKPRTTPVLPSNGFRFAEVFAGIGGFRAGLEPIGGGLVHTRKLRLCSVVC